MAHLFHFKIMFDPPLKKVVRGPPSQVGAALVRFGHSLARVKIWGATHFKGRNMVFQIMRLKVDQNEPLQLGL